MIISMDIWTENAFDKIQHPFMGKKKTTLKKLEIKRNSLSPTKAIYKRPIVHITLHGERLETFTLISETRRKCHGCHSSQHRAGGFGQGLDIHFSFFGYNVFKGEGYSLKCQHSDMACWLRLLNDDLHKWVQFISGVSSSHGKSSGGCVRLLDLPLGMSPGSWGFWKWGDPAGGAQLKPLCSPLWHSAILSVFLLEMTPSHTISDITNALICTGIQEISFSFNYLSGVVVE